MSARRRVGASARRRVGACLRSRAVLLPRRASFRSQMSDTWFRNPRFPGIHRRVAPSGPTFGPAPLRCAGIAENFVYQGRKGLRSVRSIGPLPSHTFFRSQMSDPWFRSPRFWGIHRRVAPTGPTFGTRRLGGGTMEPGGRETAEPRNHGTPAPRNHELAQETRARAAPNDGAAAPSGAAAPYKMRR